MGQHNDVLFKEVFAFRRCHCMCTLLAPAKSCIARPALVHVHEIGSGYARLAPV